jgi:hypothetical protein
LPLVTGRGVAVIGFHRSLPWAVHLRGQGGMASPPAPAIAGPDLEAHCPGDAPGRTSETPQKGGEEPGRERPLAPVQQGRGEVVEGALAAMTPGACTSGAVLICAPRATGMALAPRPWERTILPPEDTDVRLALFGVEEVGDMGAYRHG